MLRWLRSTFGCHSMMEEKLAIPHLILPRGAGSPRKRVKGTYFFLWERRGEGSVRVWKKFQSPPKEAINQLCRIFVRVTMMGNSLKSGISFRPHWPKKPNANMPLFLQKKWTNFTNFLRICHGEGYYEAVNLKLCKGHNHISPVHHFGNGTNFCDMVKRHPLDRQDLQTYKVSKAMDPWRVL